MRNVERSLSFTDGGEHPILSSSGAPDYARLHPPVAQFKRGRGRRQEELWMGNFRKKSRGEENEFVDSSLILRKNGFRAVRPSQVIKGMYGWASV